MHGSPRPLRSTFPLAPRAGDVRPGPADERAPRRSSAVFSGSPVAARSAQIGSGSAMPSVKVGNPSIDPTITSPGTTGPTPAGVPV